MTPREELAHNGYYRVAATDGGSLRNDILACTGSQNNYHSMAETIRTRLLPTIHHTVNAIPQPVYSKFRISNNTNAEDAAAFHGDFYNFTDNPTVPVYTCLIYLDNAQMEVIPRTHDSRYADQLTAGQKHAQRTVLSFTPGDMLIFHGNLHHRGKGFTAGKDRRLLQVFNVYPTPEVHAVHNPLLHTMTTADGPTAAYINRALGYLSKMPVAIDVADTVSYRLMCAGASHKVALVDIPDKQKQGKYMSYAPGASKKLIDCTEQEPWNVNVTVDDKFQTMPPSKHYAAKAAGGAMLATVLLLGVVAVYASRHPTRKK
jgi:hypothetical protein